MHPLAAIADLIRSEPPPLVKVEVRHTWQVAFYVQHGFRLKYCQRGNRAFMVRNV